MTDALDAALRAATLDDLAARRQRALAAPGRGLVLAAEPARAQRAAGPDEDARAVLGPDPDLEDALLRATRLAWATPVTGPLPEAERHRLEALPRAALPADRRVVLADAHLLARLTDDPEGEAEAIRQRLARVLPDGWRLAEGDAPRDDRRARIDRWARAAADAALDRRARALDAEAERLRVEGDATEADRAAVLDAAERTARAWLAGIRRATDELLVALRAFLAHLQADLPDQILAVEDRRAARRALAPWLAEVIDGWLRDAVGRANRELAASLGAVSPDVREAAALLVPDLHPDPIEAPGDWRARLGATATLGGGAGLLWAGLWVPGLLGVVGGLGWTAALRRAADDPGADALVQAGRQALRHLGRDAEALLAGQREAVERALDGLTDRRLQAWSARTQAARDGLAARTAALARARAELADARQRLDAAQPTPESA